MFNIGPNTFWLDLHGLLMFLVLVFAAFLFGAIFYYGGQVITNPTIKRSVLSLMFLTGAWTLALGGMGVYITKILTFPVGQ